MKIYPAIDIYGGKVVRLYQGDFDKSETFGDDPLEVAMMLRKAGACCVHVVDLDGARMGRPVNIEVIAKLKQIFECVHYGGGLRTVADIKAALDKGADKVTAASIVWQDDAKDKLAVFKARIIPALDVKGGTVALSGWQRTVPLSFCEAMLHLREMGYDTVLVTSVERDGTKRGPDIKLYEKLSGRAPEVNIIAAGGISSLEDVKALADMGIFGAVIGRALYDGSIDPKRLFEEAANA